jgi:hypothetical protein
VYLSTSALIEMCGTEMTESVGGSNDSKLVDPSRSSGKAGMEQLGEKKRPRERMAEQDIVVWARPCKRVVHVRVVGIHG